jgi:hypothetical protein
MIVKQEYETLYWKLIKQIGSYNDKWIEIVTTKTAIIDNLIKSLDSSAKSILFTSFNPIALELANYYDVAIICNESFSTSFDFSKINRFSSVDDVKNKYDIVIALDEYFTYADSENQQRELMNQLIKTIGGWLITTLQDYKNFAPYKKNQIDALSINSEHNYIMLENSIADRTDKQVWNHYFYCIQDHFDLIPIGPIKRRTMYFKQLAKYSSDAGSKQYVIQKNLLYKGFFSKNFEHIITVKF